MSKCLVQCAFLVKVISIDFRVERYIVFQEKYVSNLYCGLNVSYKRKNVHEVLVNCLFKLAQEKVWLGNLTVQT